MTRPSAACALLLLLQCASAPEPVPPGSIPAAQRETPSQARPYDEDILPVQPVLRPPSISPEAIKEFARAYRLLKQPRIAVYLNRELSDEVREWVSGDVRVLTEKQNSDGKARVRQTEWSAVQTYVYPGGRPAPPNEIWMWEFEDGLVAPFLSVNANLVDRATILRLAAASVRDDGGGLPAQRIEMEALQKYADIFIEVLVARMPGTDAEYAFKATAMDVRSGRILSSITSQAWPPSAGRVTQVEVSSGGYTISRKFPPVREMAERIAAELMTSLVTRWSSTTSSTDSR